MTVLCVAGELSVNCKLDQARDGRDAGVKAGVAASRPLNSESCGIGSSLTKRLDLIRHIPKLYAVLLLTTLHHLRSLQSQIAMYELLLRSPLAL